VSHLGYLYIAGGTKHLKEAAASATRLKEVSPGAHVTLFTNSIESLRFARSVFDEIEERDMTFPRARRKYDGKVYEMSDSPYERTIFLDTDTHIIRPLEPLFDVLDYFDLAGVPVPKGGTIRPGIPMLNSGMIAFKRSNATAWMFKEWVRLYHEMDSLGDQIAFAQALINSNVRYHSLNSCWNLKVGTKKAKKKFPLLLTDKVRMVHARLGEDLSEEDLERMVEKLDNMELPGIWHWGLLDG
jgi:hypothetical protein